MVNKELLNFIKKEKAAGKTNEEIRAELIPNNWNEDDIQKGLKKAEPISRLKFYLYLYLFSIIIFSIGFFVIWLTLAKDCQEMECMAAGIVGGAILIGLLFIIFLLNIIFPILYERKNQTNKKHKFIAKLHFVLIILFFASNILLALIK